MSAGLKMALTGGGVAIFIAVGVFLMMQFATSERDREMRQWQSRMSIVIDSRYTDINRWIDRQLADLRGIADNASVQLYLTVFHESGTSASADDAPPELGYLGNLLEVVKLAKPTVLIGTSTVHGAFTQEVVEAMQATCECPIIFPLSNPTEKSEADPEDVLTWTNGKAIIATGSPYDPVKYNGKSIRISQCNNAFMFPGLGLGIIAVKAKRVTDKMLEVASQALSECSPAQKDPTAPLLPDFDVIHEVSKKIALAVAEQARKEGVAGLDDKLDLKKKIDAIFWIPEYLPYEKMS